MDAIFDYFPFILFGGVALLIIVAIVWSIRVEKQRTEDLKGLADELGLPFHPKGDQSLVSALSSLHLFSQGRARKTKNMIHGDTDEVELGIFDYQFTTGSGKNSHTYRQTVVCFRSSQLKLPHFEMRPQHFFHAIGKVFGYQDIDFDTHPVFSKNFVLRGSDEEAVRRLFTTDVLSYLEGKTGISVEAQGEFLVFYRGSKRAKAAEIRALMEEGFDLFGYFRA